MTNKHKESSSSSISSRVSRVYVKKNQNFKITASRTKVTKKTKDKNMIIKKKVLIRKQSIQSVNSIDLTKFNLDSLRPPKVWNYPIFRLRKIKLDKNDAKSTINNIREVDPTKCYVDGRVQKFNKLFETLYKNMRIYWNTGKKADTWEYFYDKVLKALNIKYQTDKLLRREQIKKAKEEEERKKKEEEERKKEDENKVKEDQKEEEDKKVEDKIEDIKEDNITSLDETKKERNIIAMTMDEDKKKSLFGEQKSNNVIMSSENTLPTNGANTNSSYSFIKKLKLKPKGVVRNKKDNIFTNETTT
jgi:hypothetical protein